MNTMPDVSARWTASRAAASWSMSLSASSSASTRRASRTVSFRRTFFLGMNCLNMSWRLAPISSMPGTPGMEAACCLSSSSISTVRSSRPPLARSAFISARPSDEPPGSRASSNRASASSRARDATLAFCSSSTIVTDERTRSRTIDSTSRPTYPTSVNFVASTLRKGALASFARRRAISVLPTPVGPIMRMFFGVTSACMLSSSCRRR